MPIRDRTPARRPRPTALPRPAGPVLLTSLAVLALAACGSDSGSGTAAPAGTSAPAAGTSAPATGTTAASPAAPESGAGSTPAGPTTAAGPGRCSTGQLAGALRAGDAGAGQRSAVLVLTNRGERACRLDGYGGVLLVDPAGRALPTRQVRDPQRAPESVVLEPGAAGSSLLRWTVVPGAGDRTTGPCQPAPGALQVIPPDERAHLSVAWSAGPVCGGGRITQGAYRSGTGAG